METNEKKKMIYVPPMLEVTMVVLEEVIAASPVQKVNLKDWEEQGSDDDLMNNADVWLFL